MCDIESMRKTRSAGCSPAGDSVFGMVVFDHRVQLLLTQARFLIGSSLFSVRSLRFSARPSVLSSAVSSQTFGLTAEAARDFAETRRNRNYAITFSSNSATSVASCHHFHGRSVVSMPHLLRRKRFFRDIVQA